MAAQQVIAIDLGGTKLAAGRFDSERHVVRRLEEETELGGEEALLAQLERVVSELGREPFTALGVGVPSTIDQRSGRAVASVNIPLEGVDLRDRLGDRFGVPVAIENDANAAALAEHRLGAGRGSAHMIMLTLGTGVGGGLILDGRLYRGALGAAGELGHITIDVDGPPCQGACPGRGHLEALASGTAVGAAAARTAVERPEGDLGRAAAQGLEVDARLAVKLASRSPGDARDVLVHAGFHLGVAVASYVNVFDPEVVVIGGGLAAAGDLVLEPARRVVAEQALSPARDVVRIVPGELGADAGLVGAALVALELLGEP